MKPTEVLVACGDLRMNYLAKELEKAGYEVKAGKLPTPEEIKEAKYLILPVPVSRNMEGIKWNGQTEILPISDLCAGLRAGHRIYGGVIPPVIRKACDETGALFFDFMEMEEVAKKNAVATAEGTIAEAISLGEGNLHGSECLVIGYGKCGRELADKLKGMRANVTVMARREEVRREAKEKEYMTSSMGDFSFKYEYVFNTVPAMVLPEEGLKQLSKDVVIIDIASKPGGVDFAYCEKVGLKAKLSLGLPGKYSPKTSGEILAEAFLKTEKNEN